MSAARRASIALLSILGACSRGEREPSHADHEKSHADEERDHSHAREDPAVGGLLRIAPEMLRDLRVTTARAEVRAGGEGSTFLGELRVNESAYAEVGSPIPARVRSLLAEPGESVERGRPLVELESVELGRARAEYRGAAARAALASQALERKRRLAEEGIAPRRELEEAEAEAASATAAETSARATLEALGVSLEEPHENGGVSPSVFALRSPIAGSVLERSAVRGVAVDASRTLFRIADLSRLWLVVHAFERDAVRVRTGSSARLTFPALPGRTFAGSVSLVGSEVDVGSRTIPVRIDIANDEGLLRPGMSASVWVPLDDPSKQVLAVPAAALQRLGEGWCAFVPRGEGTYEIRKVGRGRDLADAVEILHGLAEGETIVVQGSFLLKAEVEKSRGGGEHEH